MDKKLFLSAAEKGRGPAEAPGMHTRTKFYVMVDGAPVQIKEAHEVFDDAGNKQLEVHHTPLACGCIVDDTTKVVMLDGKLYCSGHVHACPVCGSQIVPGTGQLIGQGTAEAAWYHESCAEPYRKRAEIKRATEQGVLVARMEAARQAALLAGAQVQGAKVSTEKVLLEMRIQKARLRFEKKRERSQRALLAAQAYSVEEGVRIQEENLGLQRDRLQLEALQAVERMALERRSQEAKERALDSQLANEGLQREIASAGLQAARLGQANGRKQLP